MINLSELRHGSIIKFDDDSNDVVRVDFILFEECSWFVQWYKISGDGNFQSGKSLLEDFVPVEVTTHVLKKCNFIIGEFTCDLNKLSIHMPSNMYKNGRTYFKSWCIMESVPKTIHLLQNLIFSLAGEELQYQP